MVTASFRFHDELNDFLPRARRGRAFATPCARAATTKHMIEALGVPHTEVALILVNGETGGFDRLLEEGDRVAVYPKCESAGIAPLLGERPLTGPPRRLRFVADAHLGGLARLLRMAGFDTLYDNHYHDDEIVAIASNQDRVVLTRDRELLKRRAVTHGCYLHSLKPAQQFQELFDRLDLAASARPFTICLHCNQPLRAVEKAAVLDRLPPSVRELHDEFNTCDCCGRVFWKGSHHKRMTDLLASVTGAARQFPAGVESAANPDSEA
jgi:uncharacterized protein with PIN domain